MKGEAVKGGAFTLVRDLSPRAVATAPVVALTYAVPSCLWVEEPGHKGEMKISACGCFLQGDAKSSMIRCRRVASLQRKPSPAPV
jgi:hypothetical protein